MPPFEIGSQDFLLDGRPLQVVSGGIDVPLLTCDQADEHLERGGLPAAPHCLA